MKKIFYIAVAAAALAAVSCAKVAEFTDTPAQLEQGFTLKFTCGDMATRADGDTFIFDSENNENRIERIDYFIFPLGEDGNVADDTEYKCSGEIVPGEGNDFTTMDLEYTVTIEPGVLAQIFPNGNTKAMVLAVANYMSLDGITETTWKDIRDLEVGDTFTCDAGEGYGRRWPHPMQTNDDELFFVMTAEQEIELNTSGTHAVDATIPLKRLASKVTVEFTYDHAIFKDDKDVTWVPETMLKVKPDKLEARVYLSNAFCNSRLGGPLNRALVKDGQKEGESMYVPRDDRDIFEYAYDFLSSAKPDSLNYYYTYPYPAGVDTNGDNQPYLKLVMPWYGYVNYESADNPGIFYKKKEVYYKVVLPSDSITESNKIYQYVVDVKIFGSETEVEVTGEEYKVKDWLTSDGVESSVATGRYISLDIPRDEYDMYSSLLEILFVSSGDVEISNLKIYQDDFSSATSTQIDFITGKNGNNYTYGSGKNANTEDIDGHKLSEWATISGTKLVINHTMNNDFSDTSFDAAPMTFIVTLHLKNETSTSFDRTVTVTQYPALYVTKDAHYGYVYVNTYGGNDDYVSAYDDNPTNAYTYNYLSNRYNVDDYLDIDHFLGNIIPQTSAMSGSSNSNPNNYNVHVSVLSNNSKGWVISDPREKNGTTLSGIAVDNYKKTDSASSLAIAPAFKIASSYGMCVLFQNRDIGGPNYENAIKRCASYQENGYPAGRWRVPTEAEIDFCVSLSEYGKIPSLFGGQYFASSGRYYDTTSSSFKDPSGADDRHVVRCVYDIWYWGEEKNEECYSGTDANGNKLYNTWGGFHD